MKRSISFGIPTFNRAEMLEEALDYYYNTLHLQEYTLHISDNASDDNTPNVVAKYMNLYNNIVYSRQETNIGADRNFIFLQDSSITDYFMILGDGVRIRKEIMEKIISITQEGHVDGIFMDYGNRTRGKYPSKIYTDKDKFLSNLGWYITQLSSIVLSRKVLELTKGLEILYDGCEFNYYKRCFEYAARQAFQYQWLNVDSMFFSSIPKYNTWTNRKAKVWFTEFTSTIMSLPSNYSLSAKMACLHEASQYYCFTKEAIVNDIVIGNITESSIQENKEGIKLLVGEQLYNYFLYISMLDKKKQRQELNKLQIKTIKDRYYYLRSRLGVRTRIKHLFHITNE